VRVSRRTRTLLIAWIAVILGSILVLFLPVPYVVLTPTTPVDTLGPDPQHANRQVLDVHGPSYPTTGHLQLTTVGVVDRVSLGLGLWRWAQGRYAVLPRSVVYPPDRPKAEVDKENVQQMTDSRSTALIAALDELRYPETVIGDFADGSKAKGVLQVGDKITEVDGKPVTTLVQIREIVATRKPGDSVTVVVSRAGKPREARVTLIEDKDKPGTPLLGIARVSVDINLEDISGPSAGLMFSLGMIDKLTPGELTGGRTIAGTGTIAADGTVGFIGGIQQKLFGAKANGAGFFLVPEDNCGEARDASVAGLTLVRVPAKSGLHVARAAVEEIGRGGRNFPLC
jgi:PDZ domain-containing protein